MKKPINTKLHGLLDYIAGGILILPWITGYFEKSEDTWLLALAGFATVLVSLFTNYEMGLIKAIPMTFHLVIDVLQAAFLILLPFTFPLYHYAFYWPVILGCGELLIVILSSSRPYSTTEKDINIIRH